MPPKKKVVLRTGEVCKVAGRYGRKGQEDPEPEVTLLPGDIAPAALNLADDGKLLGVAAVEYDLLGLL